MKAAVWREKGRFEIVEAADPAPGTGEVVLRVAYCGVCGSDIHRACTHGEISPGVVIGHEYCGAIAAVGAGVSGWKEGDRVTCASVTPDVHSRPRFTPKMVARTGEPGSLHQGAFAEYKRLAASNLLAIPPSVDDFTASLIEPTAIAVHAVERAQIAVGDRVGILGLGCIGLLVLQVAKAAGAQEVHGFDPSPVRRQAARDLGIDAVYDPREVDAVEVLEALPGGAPEVVFDCAAAPRTLDQALTAVRAHGRVVLVGMSWDPVAVHPMEWLARSVQLRTMYAYTRRQCEVSAQLIASGKVRGAAMTRPEWTFPLEGINQAFAQSVEASLVKAIVRL
ncbi:MAG: zinc-binding dehydrogenase [Candidatus Solibacter sp.]